MPQRVLKRLIVLAYGLQEYQVVGGPAWISQDQFDVEAKPDNPTDEQSRQMLRNLLEERFVCGSGWKLGMGVCPHCFQEWSSALSRSIATRGNGATSRTEWRDASRCNADDGWKRLRQSYSDSSPSRYLGQTLGRPVIDKTGLAGRYDIDARWTPESMPRDLPPGAHVREADGPSLFTALQEQVWTEARIDNRPSAPIDNRRRGATIGELTVCRLLLDPWFWAL